MSQLEKLRTYRKLKFALEKEEYLETVTDSEERRRMTALRGVTNLLRIERTMEDEAHVLLVCSTYHRERTQFLTISELVLSMFCT